MVKNEIVLIATGRIHLNGLAQWARIDHTDHPAHRLSIMPITYYLLKIQAHVRITFACIELSERTRQLLEATVPKVLSSVNGFVRCSRLRPPAREGPNANCACIVEKLSERTKPVFIAKVIDAIQ